MKQVRVGMLFLLIVLLGALSSPAQQSVATAANATVPPMIPFSSVATDEGGSSLSGVVNITFSLYAGQQGGAPLWTETQNNIPLDATGHYSAQLGITQPNGVPTTLFTTGEARWLGVRIAEQAEQPRVLLLSVPYALKAGDAATIGGLPPSAFVLAPPPFTSTSGSAPAAPLDASATTQSSAPPPTGGAVTGTGAVNFLPLWDTTSDIISSVLFQSGTGATAKIGINTTTPASTLDVKGGGTVRGTLSLPATGVATATAGKNSQPLNLAASAYNGSTSVAVNQTFQWQAEPAGNDTATPSGTLNLLFGTGATKPSETGLHIASNGQLTFATGQTFPGAGTITGVTTATGSGLTGGGVSGTLNLGLLNTCATKQVLQWNGTAWACASAGTGTVTSVGSGAGLTGGPITGAGTLSIATGGVTNAMLATSYAQLGAANTFTANQTLNGTLTATVTSASGVGINSLSSATTGTGAGVFGTSNSPAGEGVYGANNAITGNAVGVLGTTQSTAGYGVVGLQGTTTAIPGNAAGVYGATSSAKGAGVEGTGAYTGVAGTATSIDGTGVYGVASSATGITNGVGGLALSTSGIGVLGAAQALTGTTYGVQGLAGSPAGYGVFGSNVAPTGTAPGVLGQSLSSAGYGVEGSSPYIGVYGTGSTGTVGTSSSPSGTGVQGSATSTTGNNFGVYGITNSPAGYGVYGVNFVTSGTTAGVYGTTASTQGYGVEGVAGGVGGTAGFFQVSNSSATILQGNNSSTTEFRVDSAGNVSAAGAVSGSSFQIGGALFDYGSNAAGNAFLGFAGSLNTNATVELDTAVGSSALSRDTGGFNTAIGAVALADNTTGGFNTAIGFAAGGTQDLSSVTGLYNTFVGVNTQLSTGSLSNATAIGANAIVSESNALVLGSGANVGIGTSAPGHLLDVAGVVAFDSTGLNNGTTIDLTFGAGSGEGISSSRTAGPNQYGLDLYTDYNRRISIEQHGNVGIGTTSPDNLLTVNGSADKPGGGSWGTFSDGRLKTVNGGFTAGLSQVMKIHPVHYRYKPDNAMGIRDMDEHIGVVAQEVKQVIPEAVTENSKGYLLVNNDPIIWSMLNAIKEQQGQIRKQQSLLRAQTAAMRSLKAEVRETRESLRKVKAQVAAAQPALVAAK